MADRLRADLRATTMLLDALAALRLLDKQDDRYCRARPSWPPLLTADSPAELLPMIQHRMNMLRGWSQLAWVAKAGIPAPRQASIRGPAADRAAFIAAMHTFSGPVADDLVARLGPPQFTHLLDVGGASGTWTMAFLRAVPGAKATIFDLPDAIEQARAADRRHRVRRSRGAWCPAISTSTTCPRGADFAWVSAIVHQHSREHNRAAVRQGPRGADARRADRHPRHRHGRRPHAAGRRGAVRHQHAGQHRHRRHLHLRRSSPKTSGRPASSSRSWRSSSRRWTRS